MHLGLMMLFLSYVPILLGSIPHVLAQGFSDIQGLSICGVSNLRNRASNVKL